MSALAECGIGYNPAFVRRVQEKRKAARSEAMKVMAYEDLLRSKIEEQKARLDEIERQRQATAHEQFIEYNVIPIDRKNAKSIAQTIAAQNGYSFAHLTSDSRCRTLVKVRDKAIRAIADARPDMSCSQIGRLLSRDHTTVLYSLKKTKKPGQPR